MADTHRLRRAQRMAELASLQRLDASAALSEALLKDEEAAAANARAQNALEETLQFWQARVSRASVDATILAQVSSVLAANETDIAAAAEARRTSEIIVAQRRDALGLSEARRSAIGRLLRRVRRRLSHTREEAAAAIREEMIARSALR